jgi:hypothetical protein
MLNAPRDRVRRTLKPQVNRDGRVSGTHTVFYRLPPTEPAEGRSGETRVPGARDDGARRHQAREKKRSRRIRHARLGEVTGAHQR